MRQVVDGEGELEAILALLALPDNDACVVNEPVETDLVREDPLCQSAYLSQRGEVRKVRTQPLAASLVAYRLKRGFQASSIASVQQHGGALTCEFPGYAFAETVGGAGNQDRRSVHIPHRSSSLSIASQLFGVGSS